MEQNFPRSEQIRKVCFHDYQCGYWAALENRESRLVATARGSNPLLSAALHDPRDIRTRLPRKASLTRSPCDATLSSVLKRGPVPFLGGLIGRLSHFCHIPLQVFSHA
jgi:hypothetical protein